MKKVVKSQKVEIAKEHNSINEVNLEIDISTGDKVTPRELKYKFPLLFEDKTILINSYKLAEDYMNSRFFELKNDLKEKGKSLDYINLKLSILLISKLIDDINIILEECELNNNDKIYLNSIICEIN